MAVLLIEPTDNDLQLWNQDEPGAPTLDDVVSTAWEGLSAAAPTSACPVCGGDLQPRWSAGAGVVGGRCRDCGSELS
jgi:hypothetical protein